MAMTKVPPAPREILERLSVIFEDALDVDRAEITLAKELERDLGAESIDFLDIAFRTSKEFELGDCRILAGFFERIVTVLWTTLLSPEEKKRYADRLPSETEVTFIKEKSLSWTYSQSQAYT